MKKYKLFLTKDGCLFEGEERYNRYFKEGLLPVEMYPQNSQMLTLMFDKNNIITYSKSPIKPSNEFFPDEAVKVITPTVSQYNSDYFYYEPSLKIILDFLKSNESKKTILFADQSYVKLLSRRIDEFNKFKKDFNFDDMVLFIKACREYELATEICEIYLKEFYGGKVYREVRYKRTDYYPYYGGDRISKDYIINRLSIGYNNLLCFNDKDSLNDSYTIPLNRITEEKDDYKFIFTWSIFNPSNPNSKDEDDQRNGNGKYRRYVPTHESKPDNDWADYMETKRRNKAIDEETKAWETNFGH